MTTKTQRLIQRIQEKESFYDVAFLCEDFETLKSKLQNRELTISEELTSMTQRSTEV